MRTKKYAAGHQRGYTRRGKSKTGKSQTDSYDPTRIKPFKLSVLVERLLTGCDCIRESDKLQIIGYLRSHRLDLLKQWCDTHGNPNNYGNPKTYFQYASVIGMVKKFPFDGNTDVQERATLEKFVAAETVCARTNQRIASWLGGSVSKDNPEEWLAYKVLFKARDTVNATLGRLDLDDVFREAKHGPGVSVGIRGDLTSDFFKYSCDSWTGTNCARKYLGYAYLHDTRIPSDLEYEGVEWNEVQSVPKDFMTRRMIAIEPTFNAYAQLGAGRVMARKIKAVLHHDLTDQGANRRAAFEASMTGGYATLDLSSASDTIASALVGTMLAEVPDWLTFLEDIRSPTYRYGADGEQQVYQKWSSMGNGYTFPLQTLIYSALIRGVLHYQRGQVKPFWVYGDDLIVPTEIVPALSSVLTMLGFKLNNDKSFWDGPFRESCGGDFWCGIDVRPFYLKMIPSNRDDITFIINSLFRLKSDNQMLDPTQAILYLEKLIIEPLYGPVVEDLRGHIFCAYASWLYSRRLLRWCRSTHRVLYRTATVRSRDLRPAIMRSKGKSLEHHPVLNTWKHRGTRFEWEEEVMYYLKLASLDSAPPMSFCYRGLEWSEGGLPLEITGRRTVRRGSRWVELRMSTSDHGYFRAFWALR